MLQNDEPWPKLENLIAYNTDTDDYDPYNYNLQKFLQTNQEIKKLKLDASSGKLELPNICQTWNLPHMDSSSSTKLSGLMSRLSDFASLHELKIFKTADVLSYLTDPFVHETQESIINLAEKLSHLKKFCSSQIKLVDETVLGFIRCASNLEEIHIHHCGFEITANFILKIVEVLRSSRPQNGTAPLKLFIDEDDSNDFEAIQGLNIRDYLRVDSNCNHE